MPQLLVISDANVLIDMEAGGLLAELVRRGHIKAARARRAYDAMRAADRWLPSDDVERQIKSFKG